MASHGHEHHHEEDNSVNVKVAWIMVGVLALLFIIGLMN